jgi:hypothetical protein
MELLGTSRQGRRHRPTLGGERTNRRRIGVRAVRLDGNAYARLVRGVPPKIRPLIPFVHVPPAGSQA